MNRRRRAQLSGFFLVLLLAAGPFVLPAQAAEGAPARQAGAFVPSASVMLEAYAEKYGWEKEKMLAGEWSQEIGGRTVRFERQSGYQTKFLEDNAETTKLYLNEQLGSQARSGADLMIETAGKEAGTGESPKGSGRTPYSEWYYGEGTDLTGKPWGAVFLAWTAERCGFLGGLFAKTDSAAEQHDWLTGERGFSEYSVRDTKFLLEYGSGEGENDSAYEIVPGDILFWRSESAAITHIGIVSGVTDRTLTVIEGDAGDSVQIRRYSRSALLAASAPGGSEEHGAENGNGTDPALSRLLGGTVVHVEYPAAAVGRPGSSGTLENAKVIYRYLKGLGAPDAMIAGCLGNWSVESGIDPTGVEGIYDEPHVIGPRKTAAMADPGSYTLYDLKPRTKIRVNWDAYRGRDGVYYPGIGLGGFTGPAATDLMDLAAGTGGNWYDLEVQLRYCTEKSILCRDGRTRPGYRTYFFTGESTQSRYASMTASQAAYHFFHDWEGMQYSQYYKLNGAERSAKAEEYLKLFRSW